MKAAPARCRTPPIGLCGMNPVSMSCCSAPATQSICAPMSPRSSSRHYPRPTAGSSQRYSVISSGWGWTRLISLDCVLKSGSSPPKGASSADEFGLPLLAEGRHALGVVVRHMQLRLHHALDFEIVFEAGTDSRVKELLCQPEGESGTLGQFRREFLGLAQQ